MRKKFITDVIKHNFTDWGCRKIFLNAPTGAGKTTFILTELLPYLHRKNAKRLRPDKKLLILCNRRMLRKQYFYDIMVRFDHYAEVKDAVDVVTYQELSIRMKERKTLSEYFTEYAVICLDEIHFLYQDADFNGLSTFPLLRAILLAGIEKQMIFISATMDCVFSLIKKELYLCWKCRVDFYYEDRCGIPSTLDEKCIDIEEPVAGWEPSYEYIHCICVPDQKTLCQRLAGSDGKSVVFIDDKKWADDFCRDLIQTGKIGESEVCRMNAENLDDEGKNPVMKALVMANRLMPKVLITTSVLDNGVSIKDPEVQNVVIFTESEVSFKQMIGRIRTESIENGLNLYFIPRPAEYFERREIALKRYVDKIDEIKKRGLKKCFSEMLYSLLNSDDEESSLYRKFIIFYPELLEADPFFDMEGCNFKLGNVCFAINPFAEQKLGDLYLTACKFHKMAREDELMVIREQMKWLGLDGNTLQIEESDYLKERERLLVEKLLTVKEVDNKQFADFKKEISLEFRKDLFDDIVAKNGSFSTEKLRDILERFGCMLVESNGSDGKKRYSICEMEKDTGDE